jgi:tetratricopeptide (TPR) repeat protein
MAEQSLYGALFNMKKRFQCAIPTVLVPFLMLITLGALTHERNAVWRDPIVLWTDVIAKSPLKARGHYNAGLAFHERKLLDEAIERYTRAISLKPDHYKAFMNRGNAYDDKGGPLQAIEDYNIAINLNPDDAEIYYNRGVAYNRAGMLSIALPDLRKSCTMGLERGCEELRRVEAKQAPQNR